jgi:drug/metabolite transporter (DMT)-like permease
MVKGLAVITLITWEHIINLVVVFPILLRNTKIYKSFNLKDFFLFVMVGCGASALGILCFTRAFLFINPALAVLLQKLQPIMTILLGSLILKESVCRRFFFWALIAIVSSYFVSFGFTYPFQGEWKKIATGAGYALLAAFFWGSGTIWGKMLLNKYDQLFVMANRFLFGAVFTITLALSIGNGLETELIFAGPKPAFFNIVYMALVSGFLATSFFYTGLKWVKASLASILELLFPVSSVLIMWLSFNKPINSIQILSAAIMFLAVYRINVVNEKAG